MRRHDNALRRGSDAQNAIVAGPTKAGLDFHLPFVACLSIADAPLLPPSKPLPAHGYYCTGVPCWPASACHHRLCLILLHRHAPCRPPPPPASPPTRLAASPCVAPASIAGGRASLCLFALRPRTSHASPASVLAAPPRASPVSSSASRASARTLCRPPSLSTPHPHTASSLAHPATGPPASAFGVPSPAGSSTGAPNPTTRARSRRPATGSGVSATAAVAPSPSPLPSRLLPPPRLYRRRPYHRDSIVVVAFPATVANAVPTASRHPSRSGRSDTDLAVSTTATLGNSLAARVRGQREALPPPSLRPRGFAVGCSTGSSPPEPPLG